MSNQQIDGAPVVETEDNDQLPPAWLSEPGAWEDVLIEQAPHLDPEPLQTDDDLIDITPAKEGHTPNYLADSIETLEIFDPTKLEPFAKAKLQKDALRQAAGGAGSE